jgi:hypothetical protein
MLYTSRILAHLVIETHPFDLPSLFQKIVEKPVMTAFRVDDFILFFCLIIAFQTGLASPFPGCHYLSIFISTVALLVLHGFRSIRPSKALLTGSFLVAFLVWVFLPSQTENEIAMDELVLLNRFLSVRLCRKIVSMLRFRVSVRNYLLTRKW